MSFSDRWRLQRLLRRLKFAALLGLFIAAGAAGGLELKKRGILHRWKAQIIHVVLAPAPPLLPAPGTLGMPAETRKREPSESTPSLEPIPPEAVMEAAKPKPKPKPKPKLIPMQGYRPRGFRRFESYEERAAAEREEAKRAAAEKAESQPLRQEVPVMGAGPSQEQVKEFARTHQDETRLARLKERVEEENAREARNRLLIFRMEVAGAIAVAGFLAALFFSGFHRVLFGNAGRPPV